MAGKWHSGYLPHFDPLQLGCGEFYVALLGGLDYFTQPDSRDNHDWWEGEEAKHKDGDLSNFLAPRGGLCSVHRQWVPRDNVARVPILKNDLYDLSGGNMNINRKMIHHLGEGIGQLMQALAEHGMADNTLVVFTDAHGGDAQQLAEVECQLASDSR